MDIAAAHIARFERMQQMRTNWDSHWQRIRNLIFPDGDPYTSTEHRGRQNRTEIYDNTGEQAAELLASALHGMLTNPAMRWFGLKFGDQKINEQEETALWLEVVNRRMMGVFNSTKSTFGSEQYVKYMNLACYGTGPMFIDENLMKGPTFQSLPLAECFIDHNAEGFVDSLTRLFRLTARQAVQKFPNGDLPEKIRAAAEDPKKADQEFQFLHVVEPRLNRDSRRRDKLNMPYAEIYLSLDYKAIVEEGGFPEFPYTSPRWSRRASERYGRGPGSKALPDVGMLQRTMKATIRGAEKTIDPPLQLADDGIMSVPRLTTGALNYVRSDLMRHAGGAIQPITTGARPDLGEDMNQGIRQRIQNAFYHHLLQMFQDPRMTATQVIKQQEEMLRVLGPIIGRLQVEDLGPMIDRVFSIMLRAGAFDPIPEFLQGLDLDVEYFSPIARSQQYEDARGIAQTMDLMAPIIGVQPEIMDNIDGDLSFRKVAAIFGWPQDTLRSTDGVSEIRTGRQEQARAEAEKQDMIEGAGAAAKLLPALKQAGPEGQVAA